MKRFLLVIGGLIAVVAVIIGIVFGGNALGLWSYSFFAPKYENVRRDVFENTQSYVEGKRQSLTNYYDDFRKASPAEKSAIRKLMMQEFSNFDVTKLNETQYGWYQEMINYNYTVASE